MTASTVTAFERFFATTVGRGGLGVDASCG
jgi:hypothetical protein